MFRRKLQALEFFPGDKFNIYNEKDRRHLVVWLEDQKIRRYPIEYRAAMRDTENSNWPAVFEQYLKDVGCPLDRSDSNGILDWLIGLAGKLVYTQAAEKYVGITSENIKESMRNAPRIVHVNPLDNLDFESQDFKEGVISIAKLLKITPHPDILETLVAISKVIKKGVQQSLVCDKLKDEEESYPKAESDFQLGNGDPVVDQCGKILQLLHIRDMRILQTQINETIVTLQKLTANPKTDTKLGKGSN